MKKRGERGIFSLYCKYIIFKIRRGGGAYDFLCGNYTPLLQVFSAFEKPLLKQTTNTDDRLIYYKAFR